MKFDDVKKGDSFYVNENSGERVKLTVGNYNKDYGYYVEGRASNGGRIGFLQDDSKVTDPYYQIPFSETRDWINEETSKFQIMGD